MFFEISIESSKEAVKKLQLIEKCLLFLKEELKTKVYGNNLNGILIGFICTNEPEGYEFFKERKPKYHKKMELKDRFKDVKINGVFVYDMKLNKEEHKIFVESNDQVSLNLFLNKMKEYLVKLDLIPNKLDFNKDQFLKDFDKMLEYLKTIK